MYRCIRGVKRYIIELANMLINELTDENFQL